MSDLGNVLNHNDRLVVENQKLQEQLDKLISLTKKELNITHKIRMLEIELGRIQGEQQHLLLQYGKEISS